MTRLRCWQLRRWLYGSARLLGDIQALRNGRIGERLLLRMVYRLFGRLFR